MKSKIQVVIHKQGSENENLLRMVANHNEGTAQIDLSDIVGYMYAKKAMFPTVSNYRVYNDNGTLNISEDNGESFTLSLTFVELHELQPETPQDTNQAANEAPSLLLYDQTRWDDAVQFPGVN